MRKLFQGHLQLGSQLLVRGVAPELFGEGAGRAADQGNLGHRMHGQADRLGLVRQGPLHRLFDPPGGIGAQLSALGWIVPVDRLDEADIALADKVQQGKPEIAVIEGNLNDESQICLYHLLPGRVVALAYEPSQLNLLFDRQKRGLPNFTEVKLQAIVIRSLPALRRGRRTIWKMLFFVFNHYLANLMSPYRENHPSAPSHAVRRTIAEMMSTADIIVDWLVSNLLKKKDPS